eukprot:Sspe_Gene.84387::Locus_55400_Transcript_2_3_Confidence_0.500_Length_874::g.84387::m.84387
MLLVLLALLPVVTLGYHGSQVVNTTGTGGARVTVTLDWDYSPQEVAISLSVSSTTNTSLGWIGIGWSDQGVMVGGDFVIGYLPGNGGAACVRAVRCKTAPPPNDPSLFNVTSASYTEASGVVHMKFTRPCTAGANPIKSSGSQPVLFAAASAGTPGASKVPGNCIDPFTIEEVHDFMTDVANITFAG